MKAYGIFDGGGVKGAALAGCLAAAKDHDVDFIGYGGTSASSIVACLAAVGYKGAEIRDLMVGDLS
jgi:NTE family protein